MELGLTAGFVTTKITRHPQVACFSGRLNLMRHNNVCPNLSSLWLVSHRFIMMILSQKVNGFPYQVAHRLYHPWTNKHRGSSSQIWLNTIYSSNHVGQNEGYLALDDFGFLKGDLPIWSIEWSLPFRSHVGSVGCQPPPFTIKVVPPNYVFCCFGL